RQRFKPDLDARELTGAAGLLLVGVIVLDRASDGLAIGDLRRTDIGVDLELALHAIDDDLEVKLAHALDDRLPALGIDRHAERGILLRQTIERDAHLLLIALGLRLDRDLDDRLRELHALEHDGLSRIA